MKKIILYGAPLKVNERYWFPYLNAVYSFGVLDKKIKKEFALPTAEVYGFQDLERNGSKIILSPCHAKNMAVYDTEQGYIKIVDIGCMEQAAYCHEIAVFKNKVFILPSVLENGILVLDEGNKVHKIFVNQWEKDAAEHIRIAKFAIQDKYMWITSCDSNQVLRLDMINETYELIEINVNSRGFTGISVDGANIWIADFSTGNLIRYNTGTGALKEFRAPDELNCKLPKACAVHNHLFIFDRCIISTPAMSGQMTVLDKRTEQYQIIKNSFFDTAAGDNKNLYPASSFAKKIDEKTLWVQRSSDGEIANINVQDLTYTTFSLALEEDKIEDILTNLCNRRDLTYKEQDEVTVRDMIYYVKNLDKSLQKQKYIENGTKIWKQLI